MKKILFLLLLISTTGFSQRWLERHYTDKSGGIDTNRGIYAINVANGSYTTEYVKNYPLSAPVFISTINKFLYVSFKLLKSGKIPVKYNKDTIFNIILTLRNGRNFITQYTLKKNETDIRIPQSYVVDLFLNSNVVEFKVIPETTECAEYNFKLYNNNLASLMPYFE
jgi:hypothetical protein